MSTPFITTVTERCRMCYACVRECPVKAIRITDGQARVIGERCIACGNCVRVCSQHAKLLRSTVDEVRELLGAGRPVLALVAPSFPAEFPGVTGPQLAGMLRALGFAAVADVSFGADLVAREYARLFEAEGEQRFISTTCPAIVRYVERHAPAQVPSLSPIVSPMIAMARVMRRMRGEDAGVVFIGPCIAKKIEANDPAVAGDVDGVLTFSELRVMFDDAGLSAATVEERDFDPPHGGVGGLFPVSRGILQAAQLSEDLMTGEVVATQGRRHMVDAIREFGSGDLGARLLEVLCCDGCISGPGMTSDLSLFHRRRRVREHVSARMAGLDRAQWERDMESFGDLDLRRSYHARDQRIEPPAREAVEAILLRMGKPSPADELNCGACGYDSCVGHAIAIHENLAESAMCLPHTIDQLRRTLEELETSHEKLAATQEALVQSEKMASMGQLAAGIAHEVNNPLGVVLMYAHMLLDESRQLDAARAAAAGGSGVAGSGVTGCSPGAGGAVSSNAGADGSNAAESLSQSLALIAEQADRCKRIVSGLLHFARQNKVARARTDVTELLEAALRAVPVPPGVIVRTERRVTDPVAELDRDQVVQVLTNLLSNAVAAMPQGGAITLRLTDTPDRVTFEVEDTGTGIAPENQARIFDPFFTTKPMGAGTGLGLSVSYGIVKMHSGDIRVESQSDPAAGATGSKFTVVLPRRG